MTLEKDKQSVVLIVDDNSQVREAISDILNMYDFDCLMASNGQEGLAQYKANRPIIGLVVLDLHMPVMGGEEMLPALLELDPHARVLISSSVAEPATIQRLLSIGASAYLRKPYDVQTLVTAVQSAFDKPSGHEHFVHEPVATYAAPAMIG